MVGFSIAVQTVCLHGPVWAGELCCTPFSCGVVQFSRFSALPLGFPGHPWAILVGWVVPILLVLGPGQFCVSLSDAAHGLGLFQGELPAGVRLEGSLQGQEDRCCGSYDGHSSGHLGSVSVSSVAKVAVVSPTWVILALSLPRARCSGE